MELFDLKPVIPLTQHTKQEMCFNGKEEGVKLGGNTSVTDRRDPEAQMDYV